MSASLALELLLLATLPVTILLVRASLAVKVPVAEPLLGYARERVSILHARTRCHGCVAVTGLRLVLFVGRCGGVC